MSFSENEMRGLLTGKCIPGDMKVNEELPSYLVRKFDALQEQVQKLAAENAALKDAFHPEAVPDDLLDNFNDAIKMDGETFWEGDNCKSFSCVSNAEELIKLSLASMGGIETPATDAVIREISAKAVNEFTEWCWDESASPGDNYHLAAEKAEKYAAKFREGEQP
jgi:hypothetical protein